MSDSANPFEDNSARRISSPSPPHSASHANAEPVPLLPPKNPHRQPQNTPSPTQSVASFPEHSTRLLHEPSSSRSSAMSKGSIGTAAAPMVLYRLASEPDFTANSPGNRYSTTSKLSDHLLDFDGDSKYPSFRDSGFRDSGYNSPPRQRTPFLHQSSPSHSPSTSPLVKSSHRGFVPYEFDPAMEFQGGVPDDDEDVLHNPKTKEEFHKAASRSGRGGAGGGISWRGMCNVGVLIILMLALLALFVGYPVLDRVMTKEFREAVVGNTHINATGQAPVLDIIRQPVDKDTPKDARTRKGFDGKTYKLVYSDEFNEPGRTFYPGDDPYLEAVEMWYGVTRDLEWYTGDQVVTRDGALVITMDADTTAVPNLTPNSTAPFTAADNHDLHYRSGMLQSWNKFCFTGGYIEVSVNLPGHYTQKQYWPGAWTMGNLGRPGYQATTDGTWPYSYDECDVGTFPKQTFKNGTGPAAAVSPAGGGDSDRDGALSILTGQRLSACTCPNSDHPGPWGVFDSSGVERYRGRGAPEIDILEVQNGGDTLGPGAGASQSMQLAPFTHDWGLLNPTGQTVYDSSTTELNGWKGTALQQAMSAVTKVPLEGHQYSVPKRFVTYGFEYRANPNDRDNNFITWQVDGKPTYHVTPRVVAPDRGPGGTQVGQRLIPEEPMSVIMNLGISHGWGNLDVSTLDFPAEMSFDYIRIYQVEGEENIGCNPPDFPTTDYINRHMDQYSNWDTKTVWEYEKPRNGLYEGSC